MVRELYNVREVPDAEGELVPSPMRPDEELRFRAEIVRYVGDGLARRGVANWPAYTPEDRIRLYELVPALSERLGLAVHAEAEDVCSVRFSAGPGVLSRS
ncbi:hypothetical protein ACFQVC_01080 [Streptomyces monticola]|uniref:Uncharacterized protein n=1 Tax=Streptomyces monticola TaxID=2666263 RepID=A0ABW2JB60_9ACTN